MKTIAVINQKGGVGKTTTTVNLGHALSKLGNRVLLIDLDPQGHLAACLGLFRAPAEGADVVMLDGQPLPDKSVATRELLEVIPAGNRLGEFEQVGGGVESSRVLREHLRTNPPDVDYVIIDCPPSAGMLVINAIVAADDVLIPVAGDYLSLTGLAKLMGTIKKIESLRDSPLKKWIFLSRYIARRRLSQEVTDKIREHFPQYLLPTSIREAAVLAECAGAGRTIFEYRAKSKSAQEFAQLADDLLHGRVIKDEQQTSNVA